MNEIINITHYYGAGIHDDDPVAVDDCVQPVGNGQYRAVLELPLDRLLDEIVGAGIDVGRRLVQHEDPVPARDGTGQTEQLPLADTEVGAALGYPDLEARARLQAALHADVLEGLPQLVVRELAEGVEVLAQAARKQDRLLRDYAYLRTRR